jgi:hypothetical protein
VHVAVAVEVLDHRHLRLAADPLDQALAAARNDDVDRFRRGDQVTDRRPVGRLDQLHRVGRQAGLLQRGLDQLPERDVRVDRFRAAAQDAGVAALDRERRRLDRHVGAALVDHAEHAERHPHAADRDAARPLAQLGDLADRVRHRGDLVAAGGGGLDDARCQLQAVGQRRGEAGRVGACQVARICGLQGRAAFAQASARGPATRRSSPPSAPPSCGRWQRGPRRPCAQSSRAGRPRSCRDCRKPFWVASDFRGGVLRRWRGASARDFQADGTPHRSPLRTVDRVMTASSSPSSGPPRAVTEAMCDEIDGSDVSTMPFEDEVPTQPPSRAAISAAHRRPEPACVAALIDRAALPADQAAAAHALAARLAGQLRARKVSMGREGLVQGLIQEFSLSSQEGVALMCLAEALLRIPDAATRDALIRDKIGDADWQAHLGRSPSVFVNAATWGLLLTGKLVATHTEQGPCQRVDAAPRAQRRAGRAARRRHGDAADGRAVRHRRDDRGGAGARQAARARGLPLFVRHARRGRR